MRRVGGAGSLLSLDPIRETRGIRFRGGIEEPEARGLLALMLLNHARLSARVDPEGRIVTLDRQDRGLWDEREIAEGVRVLQSALALQRPGRYQVEAAIAALHDDAASAAETDCPQILACTTTSSPLRETDRLRDVIGERHRWHAGPPSVTRARR